MAVPPHLFAEVSCTLLFSYTICMCVLSGLHTREPILPVLQHHGGGGMKPDRELCEPVAPLHLPPIQTKEMDHLMSPRLQSGDNTKDSNGRVRAKGRKEQASFSVAVQCVAQTVTANHNLSLLGCGFSWEYIWQLQSNCLSGFPGAEVTIWEIVLRLCKKPSLFVKGQFRADLHGRASYTSVNMCKMHAWEHRSKDYNVSVSKSVK